LIRPTVVRKVLSVYPSFEILKFIYPRALLLTPGNLVINGVSPIYIHSSESKSL